MAKLADAAKTKGLTGAVTLTSMTDGTSRTYPDEAAAEAALPSGASVEHRRGAFYYGAKPKPKPARKPKRESSGE